MGRPVRVDDAATRAAVRETAMTTRAPARTAGSTCPTVTRTRPCTARTGEAACAACGPAPGRTGETATLAGHVGPPTIPAAGSPSPEMGVVRQTSGESVRSARTWHAVARLGSATHCGRAVRRRRDLIHGVGSAARAATSNRPTYHRRRWRHGPSHGPSRGRPVCPRCLPPAHGPAAPTAGPRSVQPPVLRSGASDWPAGRMTAGRDRSRFRTAGRPRDRQVGLPDPSHRRLDRSHPAACPAAGRRHRDRRLSVRPVGNPMLRGPATDPTVRAAQATPARSALPMAPRPRAHRADPCRVGRCPVARSRVDLCRADRCRTARHRTV